MLFSFVRQRNPFPVHQRRSRHRSGAATHAHNEFFIRRQRVYGLLDCGLSRHRQKFRPDAYHRYRLVRVPHSVDIHCLCTFPYHSVVVSVVHFLMGDHIGCENNAALPLISKKTFQTRLKNTDKSQIKNR